MINHSDEARRNFQPAHRLGQELSERFVFAARDHIIYHCGFFSGCEVPSSSTQCCRWRVVGAAAYLKHVCGTLEGFVDRQVLVVNIGRCAVQAGVEGAVWHGRGVVGDVVHLSGRRACLPEICTNA